MSAPVSPLPLSLTTHTHSLLAPLSHTSPTRTPPIYTQHQHGDPRCYIHVGMLMDFVFSVSKKKKKVSHIRVGKIRRDVQMEVELSETDVINIIYLLFQKTLSKCI